MTVELNGVDAEYQRWTRVVADATWRLRLGAELRKGSGAAAPVLNPANGELLCDIEQASGADVDLAVERGLAAAQAWGNLTPRDRGGAVREFADILEQHQDELAWLDTLDAGLPLWMMRKDAATGIERMRMFADLGLTLSGLTIPASAGNLHLTFLEPFGVVARIIPFNHPFMFAASKVAAPLVAGNAVVLKPSELTPLSALRMAELAQDVLPDGVLSVVHGDADIGDALVRHRGIRRIAFTGSHHVGRAIQRSAAEVGVKHVSLELGGKNAMIVFPDADVDSALQAAVKGMNFAFAGQSCGSTSRILLPESLFASFTERYVSAVTAVNQGLPWTPGVQMGPMVSAAQRDRAIGFIDRARDAGARVLAGGGVPADAGAGFFVAPTVLDGVSTDMEIAREEVFGPVVSLVPFSDEDHAVRIANDVDYGLTASVWTRELARAHRVSRRLQAGYIWVNDTSTHFPGVPFGGVKLSGIGREESVDELVSYTETKAVNVVLS
ncbi:2-formylbenzoate dehydrogenase [Mycolicibacterium vanbaalenii]|uniref:2-formylbenzoate dehydrogenase n=1 Tax=Mycolicibacterium vanbaalenii TaxID=110539 RepID=A0A5S9R324_MYCVN|nr:aldehyde dehydrogenase family protein [Mycolicibacterium vanbaalenii]CAA0128097.1 2-formylbenzoate dehydrogenase [Mycolicibacterium vanbaalenii]